jgi:hypothetical protein
MSHSIPAGAPAPSGRCGESTQTDIRGRDLWLDEHRRTAAEGAAPWGRPGELDVHLGCRGVQPGADVHAGGNGMSTRERTGAAQALRVVASAQTGSLQSLEAPQNLPLVQMEFLLAPLFRL